MIIDLHTHTSYGSPCGYMDPGQLIERAKVIGIDGVCITEHNQLWDQRAIDSLVQRHGFLVIGGVEAATDCGEILVFGLHQPLFGIDRVEELREIVYRAGGVMIAAHPFRALNASPSKPADPLDIVDEVADWLIFQYVDAIEVYNGAASMWEHKLGQMMCRRLDLRGTGGSDAHGILSVGLFATAFENEIRDEQDLIREIKEGRFEAVDRISNRRWK